jgi:hypothetical protein
MLLGNRLANIPSTNALSIESSPSRTINNPITAKSPGTTSWLKIITPKKESIIWIVG